jgi:hypothetical protein
MSKHTVLPEGKPMTAMGHKTRRAALRALVGASALAIPSIGSAASAPGDPIFTAIARHEAAYDALNATRFAVDDVMYNPEGRGVSDAEWDAYDRAHENEDEAFDELIAAAPKTFAGMRAIIAHLICIDDGRLSRKMRQLLALLLNSQVLAR